MESPLVPEVLLEHGQFVRALAHGLVRDGHAAEDVAQETWTRYFAKGPAEARGLRHWLRVVARNLAVNRSRAERGRAAREQSVARAEALASTHEELEHGELLGVVVQAVLALEEPYRSTIVERYYGGLDAGTIALRIGADASTVRSREHRALEKLRERLDRYFQGERRAWAVVLARFAGPSTASVVPTGWPVSVKVALPLLVVAGGLTLWPRTPATSVTISTPSVAAMASTAASAELTGPAALGPAAAGTETRIPLAGSSTSKENASNAALCEIRGRFVLPGGVAAAGVSVHVHGWGRNQDAALQFGEPEDWVDPQCETDEDGRFALHFEPPRAYQFTLDARATGHAAASWRWGEIAAGSTLDLGQIELPVGGTIEGHVVDAKGASLVGERWSVRARTVGLGEDDGRDDSQVIASVERDTGAFRLVDVWPTRVKLSADSDMTNGIDGPSLVVRSCETVTADIVYSGPDNARRITVHTSCRPFYTHDDPAPEHIRLRGPSGEVRTATWIAGSSQSHSFDDLSPGSYTLEIDDPAYLPWTSHGVEPGSRVTARLVGSAALQLAVIDASGQPIERYTVRVTLRSSGHDPNEFELHDGKSALGGGLLLGMLPGDYTVAVRCADGATARCEVDELRGGETRAVRLDLGSQRFVAGRVAYEGGEGVVGAEVLLLSPAAHDDSDVSPILSPNMIRHDDGDWRKELGRTESADDGAFRIDLTEGGRVLLRARAAGSQAFTASFAPEEARKDLVIVLPEPGAVRGHVRVAPGASFDGLALWIPPSELWTTARPPGPAGHQELWDMRESLTHALAPLAPDGAFALEGLRPGTARAFLVIAEQVQQCFSVTDEGISGAVLLAELEIPAGGVLEPDFDAPELPGWAALDLLVNGQPAPFLGVTLRGVVDVCGSTDAAGHLGPERLQAGSWSVFASDRDAGWGGWLPTSVVVHAGRQQHAVVEALVFSGALTCVDAQGELLREEKVTVLRVDTNRLAARSTSQLTTRKTDANGRLTLQLLEGEYELQRGPYDPRSPTPTVVPFTWTSSGPLNERVQL